MQFHCCPALVLSACASGHCAVSMPCKTNLRADANPLGSVLIPSMRGPGGGTEKVRRNLSASASCHGMNPQTSRRQAQRRPIDLLARRQANPSPRRRCLAKNLPRLIPIPAGVSESFRTNLLPRASDYFQDGAGRLPRIKAAIQAGMRSLPSVQI